MRRLTYRIMLTVHHIAECRARGVIMAVWAKTDAPPKDEGEAQKAYDDLATLVAMRLN